MAQDQPLHIGILGAANIAKRALIEPAKQLDNIQVFGIAARDLGRAQQFAQEHNIPTVFPNYEALLNSDRLDAVYIPLANHCHAPWVMRAIEAKKPVLVEKPLCLTPSELEAIEATVIEHQGLVLEAVMVQHHPWQEVVREIVESGRYGRVMAVRTNLTLEFPEAENADNYRFSASQGGGAFFDLGTYWVQLVQLCLGANPEKIDATASLNRPEGVDIAFDARLMFPQGAIAEFHGSFTEPFAAHHQIELEQAHLTIRNFFRPLFGVQSMRIAIEHLDTGKTEKIKFPVQNYYVNQLKFFSQVLSKTVQNLPWVETRDRIRLMDEIYRAAQKSVTTSL